MLVLHLDPCGTGAAHWPKTPEQRGSDGSDQNWIFYIFFYFKSSPLLQSQRERHSSAHFHCGTNFRPSSALWTEPASSRLTRRSGDGTCGPDDTSEHHKRVESGRLKQHVPDHRYDPDGCTGHPVEEHPCEHNRLVLTQLSHLSPVRLQTSDKVLLAHRLLSPLF